MQLANVLQIDRVVILKRSTFVGFVFVQPDGAEWKAHYASRYQMYVFLEGFDMNDAVEFACSSSFGRMNGLCHVLAGKEEEARSKVVLLQSIMMMKEMKIMELIFKSALMQNE